MSVVALTSGPLQTAAQVTESVMVVSTLLFKPKDWVIYHQSAILEEYASAEVAVYLIPK